MLDLDRIEAYCKDCPLPVGARIGEALCCAAVPALISELREARELLRELNRCFTGFWEDGAGVTRIAISPLEEIHGVQERVRAFLGEQ